MHPARIALAATIAGAVAAALVACASSPDPNRVTMIYTGPNSLSEFTTYVQPVLANRCATLDCHGQIGRPLRLFSQFGLRLVDDAGNVSGGLKTTTAEIFANYTATISLQPELTSRVFAQSDTPPLDAHALLLMRKPLQLERHKGGPVFSSGGATDNCLSSWLTAKGIDTTACTAALMVP
jgi:hypothetical protein